MKPLSTTEVADLVLTPGEHKRRARVERHRVHLRRARPEGDDLLVISAIIDSPVGSGATSVRDARVLIASRSIDRDGRERIVSVKSDRREEIVAIRRAIAEALGEKDEGTS